MFNNLWFRLFFSSWILLNKHLFKLNTHTVLLVLPLFSDFLQHCRPCPRLPKTMQVVHSDTNNNSHHQTNNTKSRNHDDTLRRFWFCFFHWNTYDFFGSRQKVCDNTTPFARVLGDDVSCNAFKFMKICLKNHHFFQKQLFVKNKSHLWTQCMTSSDPTEKSLLLNLPSLEKSVDCKSFPRGVFHCTDGHGSPVILQEILVCDPAVVFKFGVAPKISGFSPSIAFIVTNLVSCELTKWLVHMNFPLSSLERPRIRMVPLSKTVYLWVGLKMLYLS